jgi:hypothetical protein
MDLITYLYSHSTCTPWHRPLYIPWLPSTAILYILEGKLTSMVYVSGGLALDWYTSGYLTVCPEHYPLLYTTRSLWFILMDIYY